MDACDLHSEESALFKVSWWGYSKEHNSWEPLSCFNKDPFVRLGAIRRPRGGCARLGEPHPEGQVRARQARVNVGAQMRMPVSALGP